MAAVSEESIVRNRLLFDNRLLKKCARRFLIQNVSGKDNDATQFLTDLSQFEVGLRKHQLIHDMTEREIELYEEEKVRILADFEAGKTELAVLKEQLAAAQIVRANKLQYDDLAGKIMVYPTRANSLENAARLKAKIEQTRLQTESITKKQELRKKQLLTLVTAIHELQDSIQEDREMEEAKSMEESFADETPTPPQEEEEEGILEEEKDAMDVA
ncbi:hypothetical protein PhCBS80983_g03782 [Powellomyces hirtus]|uniref:THO complex subunit 7 n=1 Tax=Powellomyces hirtus TaxID=109895 RepID=A0A507E329_9FUNG|nr:hypothetical protein PhCBS80983_g03782 [Powellomyces hirtus]